MSVGNRFRELTSQISRNSNTSLSDFDETGTLASIGICCYLWHLTYWKSHCWFLKLVKSFVSCFLFTFSDLPSSHVNPSKRNRWHKRVRNYLRQILWYLDICDVISRNWIIGVLFFIYSQLRFFVSIEKKPFFIFAI